MFKCDLAEVDHDGSIVSASEDDALAVEDFFRDSECSKGFIDGVVDIGTFDSQKCFENGNFSCSIEHDHSKMHSDPLVGNITHGEETNISFQYGLLKETGDEIHHGNSLPSVYEDSLLDVKPAHALFDSYYGPNEASSLGSVDLESHAAGVSGRYFGDVMSEMSSGTANVMKVKSTCNHYVNLDQMSAQELHETFRNIFGRETMVEDKQWLKNRILFGLNNNVELGNALKFLEGGLFSDKNEGASLPSSNIECSKSSPGSVSSALEDDNTTQQYYDKKESCFSCESPKTLTSDFCVGSGPLGLRRNEGEVVTQKRMRKPTRRYIEHSLERKTRVNNRKSKTSHRGARDKFLRVRSCKQNDLKKVGADLLDSVDKSFHGDCIQVPFGSPVDEEYPKELSSRCQDTNFSRRGRHSDSVREHIDMGKYSANSGGTEDTGLTTNNSQKGGSRRKHHIMWTLSEVTKLIEGVSNYGVGRWTEIKRLMFPSSSRRTSVDLKDKWRNLLKASGIELQCKAKLEQDLDIVAMQIHHGHKQTSHQIPESVLRRVRELAGRHPYPRDQKPKVSSFSAGVPTLSTAV